MPNDISANHIRQVILEAVARQGKRKGFGRAQISAALFRHTRGHNPSECVVDDNEPVHGHAPKPDLSF